MRKKPTIDTRGLSSKALPPPPKKNHLEFQLRHEGGNLYTIYGSAEDDGKEVIGETRMEAYLAAAAIVHRADAAPEAPGTGEARHSSLPQAGSSAAGGARKRKPRPLSSESSIAALIAAIRAIPATGPSPAKA